MNQRRPFAQYAGRRGGWLIEDGSSRDRGFSLSHWNMADTSFAAVYRHALFSRCRLAAIVDAAEHEMRLPPVSRDSLSGPLVEVAVALDAFLEVRNSRDGWQDLQSGDAELIGRALSLLRQRDGRPLPNWTHRDFFSL
jgi:hypothetical protein